MSEQTNYTEINFAYLELVEKDEIDIKDLPLEVRKKINTIKMLYGGYKAKPSDDRYKKIIEMDVTICDDIQDYIEKDEEDDVNNVVVDDNDDQTPPAVKTPAAPVAKTPAAPVAKAPAAPVVKTPAAPAAKAPAAPVAKTPAAPALSVEKTPAEPVKPTDAELEKKVKDKLSNEGRISVKDLIEIGIKPIYPETKVGSLILRKVPINSFFRIIENK